MSNLKKVFTSDKEDRGLFVKILKNHTLEKTHKLLKKMKQNEKNDT